MTRLPPAVRLTGIGFFAVAVDGLLDTGRLFAIVGLFAGLVLGLGGAFLLLLEVLKTPQ